MAILKALYRSKKMFSYEDNYGGNVFQNCYYTYLLLRENCMCIFSSSPMVSRSKMNPITSFDDSKTLAKLEIILKNASWSIFEFIDESTIRFAMQVQSIDNSGEVVELRRIYNATTFDEGNKLNLMAWHESDSEKIVVNEEFERIT